MGPFNGKGVEFRHRPGKYTGKFIVEDSGPKIMVEIGRCGALSRHQVAALTECSNAAKVLKRLAMKGYLDEYISGQCPPVYSLSIKGAEILKVRYRAWETAKLLRQVAANQLWVQLGRLWPDARWDASGEYPVLSRGDTNYLVAAPRLLPNEKAYAFRAYNFMGQSPLLYVAAAYEQAIELARISESPAVRYTWDDLLKDGVSFYIKNGDSLIPDKEFETKKLQNLSPEYIDAAATLVV